MERIEILKGDVTLFNQDSVRQQDQLKDDQLIADFYTNELNQAVNKGMKTVTFLCIEPSENDISVERWAQIVYHTIAHFLSSNRSLEKVTLICSTDALFDSFKKLAKLAQGEEFRATMEAKLKAGEHHTWMIKDFNRLKQNGE